MGFFIGTAVMESPVLFKDSEVKFSENLVATNHGLDSTLSIEDSIDTSLDLGAARSEVLHLLNIGEAVGSLDFESRCEMDKSLKQRAFELHSGMLEQVEVDEFLSTLPEDLYQLIEYLDSGVSTREIAKVFGVAKGTIQYRIEKLRSIASAYFASAAAA